MVIIKAKCIERAFDELRNRLPVLLSVLRASVLIPLVELWSPIAVKVLIGSF